MYPFVGKEGSTPSLTDHNHLCGLMLSLTPCEAESCLPSGPFIHCECLSSSHGHRSTHTP